MTSAAGAFLSISLEDLGRVDWAIAMAISVVGCGGNLSASEGGI